MFSNRQKLKQNSLNSPKRHRLTRKTVVWTIVAVVLILAALGQNKQYGTSAQNNAKSPNVQTAQKVDKNSITNVTSVKGGDGKSDSKPIAASGKSSVNGSAKPSVSSNNGGGYRNLPHCRVTHVSDGDTLTVDCLPTRVRLVGVDTPESTLKKQCYGKEASNYTKRLLGQSVYVETDPASGDLDRYGRPLRYIILDDGTNYNQKLIELGYGMLYVFNRQPFKYKDAFAAAEQQARVAKRGLWGVCQTAINKYGNYHVTN